MKLYCYPKYAYLFYLFLSGVCFLMGIGLIWIKTDEELPIKLTACLLMFTSGIIMFLGFLYHRQYIIVENDSIILKNFFGVIQKMSMGNLVCQVQDLETYSSWIERVSRTWICLYYVDSHFRFKKGCSNGKYKQGIQIIYTQENYKVIQMILSHGVIDNYNQIRYANKSQEK